MAAENDNNKHEGLQYKDNVRPARLRRDIEMELISRESDSFVGGGSLSTNSTRIRMAALHSYALTIASSDECIPMAEDVTRVMSTEESTWKRKYELLLSRLDEEAMSIAQEVSFDSTAEQSIESATFRPKKRHRQWATFGAVIFFVICILVLAMANLLASTKNPESPLPKQTREERAAEITSFLSNMTYSGRALQNDANSTHPSDMALVWIIDMDPMHLTVGQDRDHLLQRFALMTLILGQGNDRGLMVGDKFWHECDPKNFPYFNVLWKCDSDNVIRSITAGGYGVGLTGSLPEDVALFKGLVQMDFSDNTWTGSIPSSISTMTQLEELLLAKNHLTGTIPSSLGLLTGLKVFDVHKNQLTGTIPESLGEMTSLWKLQLSGNNLKGTVPPAIGNLSRLQRLWLQGNRLSGTLPLVHQPKEAKFYSNEFSGSMPFCVLGNTTARATVPAPVLVADCHLVECPCCSNCCPQSKGGIPVYNTCPVLG